MHDDWQQHVIGQAQVETAQKVVDTLTSHKGASQKKEDNPQQYIAVQVSQVGV